MKRIIYLTNYGSLTRVSAYAEDFRNNFFNPQLSSEGLAEYIDERGNSIVLLLDTICAVTRANKIKPLFEKIDHESIRIVHHQINNEDLNKLLEEVFSDKFEFKEDFNNQGLYTYRGMHETNGHYYPSLTKIFENNNELTNKIFDEIWEESGFDIDIEEENLLEIKISFLHKYLLKDKPDENSINSKLKEFNCNVFFHNDKKNASIIAIRNAILKS